MMSIGDALKKIATELARSLNERASHLQAELAEVEAKKAHVEEQLKTARLGPQRLFNFKPVIDANFQCLSCQSAAAPIESIYYAVTSAGSKWPSPSDHKGRLSGRFGGKVTEGCERNASDMVPGRCR